MAQVEPPDPAALAEERIAELLDYWAPLDGDNPVEKRLIETTRALIASHHSLAELREQREGAEAVERGKCANVLDETANMMATAAGSLMASHKNWRPTLNYTADVLRWVAGIFRLGDTEPGAHQRQAERDKAAASPEELTVWLDTVNTMVELERSRASTASPAPGKEGGR